MGTLEDCLAASVERYKRPVKAWFVLIVARGSFNSPVSYTSNQASKTEATILTFDPISLRPLTLELRVVEMNRFRDRLPRPHWTAFEMALC